MRVPVGSGTFIERHALNVVREGVAERLARLLAHMPNKHGAQLIVIRAATHKTTSFERGMYTRLSKAVCERVDRGRLWTLEQILELSNVAIEE